MSAAWVLLVVGVLTCLTGGHAQRGVAYTPGAGAGGCLVTARGPHAAVNVTCLCGQTLQQTMGTSPVIDHLTVHGCGAEPTVTRVAFLPSSSDTDQPEMVLLNVRSVSLVGGVFSLVPESDGAATEPNPLHEISVRDAWLEDDETGGLSAGALQSLPELRRIALMNVNITVLQAGSLADLQHLQTLEMSHCHLGVVEEGALARTVQLRHLHISHTQFLHISSHAIVVEAGIDDTACNTEADAEEEVSFLIAHCTFASLSPSAISFGGVQHLILDDNDIAELQKASLSVTTRTRCGHAARLQLTNNVASVVIDAPNVIIVNDDQLVAPLVHGGNEIEPAVRERSKQTGKFPPAHLRISGPFQMTRIIPS